MNQQWRNAFFFSNCEHFAVFVFFAFYFRFIGKVFFFPTQKIVAKRWFHTSFSLVCIIRKILLQSGYVVGTTPITQDADSSSTPRMTFHFLGWKKTPNQQTFICDDCILAGFLRRPKVCGKSSTKRLKNSIPGFGCSKPFGLDLFVRMLGIIIYPYFQKTHTHTALVFYFEIFKKFEDI